MTEITINQLCATCLKLYDSLNSIFVARQDCLLETTEIGQIFSNYFLFETNEEIYDNMGICDACKEKFETAHQFLNNCLKSITKYQTIFEGKGNSTNADIEDQQETTEIILEHADNEINDIYQNPTTPSNDNEDINNYDNMVMSENECDDNNSGKTRETTPKKSPEAKVVSSEVECPEILPVYKRRSDDSRQKFSCNCCTKTFVDEISYQAHMNWHKGLPPYSCKLCSSTFTTKFHYNTHVMKHNNIRQFVCHICAKDFITNSSLATHLLMHSDFRKFGCEICSKRFRMASHLKNHMASHNAEKKFSCPYCDLKFAVSHTAKLHFQSVHLKLYPHECSECSKKFKRKHHLTKHLKTHIK